MTTTSVAKTHTMRALTELRQRILNGDLAGGTRLYEVALAEDLQISRTPIREAMSRLAEEGLLDRARNGGFVVRRFAYADALDAIDLRGVLEGMAARMAAERGAEPARMTAIREIVARLDQCFGERLQDVDFDRYSQLNGEFHMALRALAGSTIVERELDRVTRLPFASPSAFLTEKNQVEAFQRSLHLAQEQHRAIVGAIAAREGARAEALAREHARAARSNLEHLLVEDGGKISNVAALALVVS